MKAASVFKSCVGGLLSLALCGCVQSTGLGERAIVKSIYMDFRAGRQTGSHHGQPANTDFFAAARCVGNGC